jgi:hypothetical protein
MDDVSRQQLLNLAPIGRTATARTHPKIGTLQYGAPERQSVGRRQPWRDDHGSMWRYF